MTTNELPRIIVGIPGLWPDQRAIASAIAKENLNRFLFAGAVMMESATNEHVLVDIYQHDPKLRTAFTHASMGTLDEETLSRIDRHTFTVYLISPGGSFELAAKMLRFACAVLRAGGIAVKVESAGLAQSAENWTRLAERADPDALYRGFVVRVGDEKEAYTCGMHNLGLRDAEVRWAVSPALDLLEVFSLYQILESPTLIDGVTFSTSEDAPWYRLSRQQCTRFEPSFPFHNPYGVWRMTPVARNG